MQILVLTFGFLLCEICDILINPARTFSELVFGYFRRYMASVVIFFLTQFSFIYLCFCIFYFEIYALFALFCLYILDLASKIIFIKHLIDGNLKFQDGELRLEKNEFLGISKTEFTAISMQKISPSFRILISFSSVCIFYALVSIFSLKF